MDLVKAHVGVAMRAAFDVVGVPCCCVLHLQGCTLHQRAGDKSCSPACTGCNCTPAVCSGSSSGPCRSPAAVPTAAGGAPDWQQQWQQQHRQQWWQQCGRQLVWLVTHPEAQNARFPVPGRAFGWAAAQPPGVQW